MVDTSAQMIELVEQKNGSHNKYETLDDENVGELPHDYEERLSCNYSNSSEHDVDDSDTDEEFTIIDSYDNKPTLHHQIPPQHGNWSHMKDIYRCDNSINRAGTNPMVRMHDSGVRRNVPSGNTVKSNGLQRTSGIEEQEDDNAQYNDIQRQQYNDIQRQQCNGIVTNEELELKMLVGRTESVEYLLSVDDSKNTCGKDVVNAAVSSVLPARRNNKLKDISTFIRRSFDEVIYKHSNHDTMTSSVDGIPLEDVKDIGHAIQKQSELPSDWFTPRGSLYLKSGESLDSNEVSAENYFGHNTYLPVDSSIHQSDVYEEELLLVENIRDETFVEIENSPTPLPVTLPSFFPSLLIEPEELELRNISKNTWRYGTDTWRYGADTWRYGADTWGYGAKVGESVCSLGEDHESEFDLHMRGATCRYITIKRHEPVQCGGIIVTYIHNINRSQPEETHQSYSHIWRGNMERNRVDKDCRSIGDGGLNSSNVDDSREGEDECMGMVPCEEEIVEEIVSHHIQETIVYEDEFHLHADGMVSSEYRDEWILLSSDLNAT